MQIDPLTLDALIKLGPWGLVLGVILYFAGRSGIKLPGLPSLPTPVTPTTPMTPTSPVAPAPLVPVSPNLDGTGRPLVDLLAQALARILDARGIPRIPRFGDLPAADGPMHDAGPEAMRDRIESMRAAHDEYEMLRDHFRPK